LPDGYTKDSTFARKKYAFKKEVKKVGKLGPVATFLALIKGYCAIVVLILPKSFVNGGYVFSPIILMASCALTTYCAIKLVQAGLKTRLMNYSLIG
jgi:Transmembrane amino acid transporter protein